MATSPYWQHDLNVGVIYKLPNGTYPSVHTRYIVAPSEWPPKGSKLRDSYSDELAPDSDKLTPEGLRTFPAEPKAVVPDADKIILFIHGHMSSAEEANALIPFLRQVGQSVGIPVTVIAFDLPTMGYATRFFHRDIAILNESKSTPLLDFTEQFIIDLVAALDTELGNVKDRIAAVIGGSLGGHMGLRLSLRSKTDYPWLRKIAAWSPRAPAKSRHQQ